MILEKAFFKHQERLSNKQPKNQLAVLETAPHAWEAHLPRGSKSARLCHSREPGKGDTGGRAPWGCEPSTHRKDTGPDALPSLHHRCVVLPLHPPLGQVCSGACRALARSRLMEKGRSSDNSRSPLTSLVRGSPVMFASRDSELGSALVAVGAVTPGRLLGQHICNTGRRCSCQTAVCRAGRGAPEGAGRQYTTLCRVTRGTEEQYSDWVREPSQRSLWRASTTRQAGRRNQYPESKTAVFVGNAWLECEAQ